MTKCALSHNVFCMDEKNIIKAIRVMMAERGIATQMDLARRLEMGPSQLTQILRGKLGVYPYIPRFARALGIREWQLLKLADDLESREERAA